MKQIQGGPWLSKVRVHLSRLWTDTQVREKLVVVRSQLQIKQSKQIS